jgi:hypothetical protein
VPPSIGVVQGFAKSLTICIVLAAGIGAGAASAQADQRADERPATDQVVPDPEPWRFGITSYGWAINIAGSLTARGQTVDVNASFIDLVQKSDSLLAWMSYFEADKGRVGFYGDLVWTRLGFSRSTAAYRNPLPGLQLSATANAALVTDLVIAEIGGLYEVHRWPGSDGSFTAVDALLGFRYWNSTASVSVDALATANYAPLGLSASRQFGVSLSNTMQWVDPLVGLRLRHQFTPHQNIMVRGDIGGFGLGSQLTWQALGVYSYEWQADRVRIAAVVGYRAIGVNYSAGSGFDANGLNLVFHGPVIGIGLRF